MGTKDLEKRGGGRGANGAVEERSLNFIEEIIEEDLRSGRHKSVLTRFPPEPNGYLHIGHAKSICLNFGLAIKYGGKTNLRFDDTNPTKEDVEYVDSIKEDVRWLGFQWDKELYASDYFEQLYQWAIKLINMELAYVDDQSQEEIRANRGTVSTAGTNSPFRERTIAENLDLFKRMREGEFPEGSRVLRAKIDMAHSNMLMRDPILYRILYTPHHRTDKEWPIYPMYDYAHGQSDSIERITHSLCTLEFDVHRPLYDWFIEKLDIFPSRQYEFARLNITYTVMSKRRLLSLVENNIVEGWDDPRMPTISGLRRRGYTPESIRLFADKVGVAKRDNIIDLSLLEWCVREDLNRRSNRYMVVMDPIKLVITDYPEGKKEYMSGAFNPEDPESGRRQIPFTRELYIERDDFMEDPPRRYFRLKPGGEVRLKYSYIVKCEEVIKDADGNVVEIRATHDPDTRPGAGPWRSVRGTIHWVSVEDAKEVEVRLFDRLFLKPDMDNLEEGKEYVDYLNPDSLKTVKGYGEEALLEDKSEIAVQFERSGYFVREGSGEDGRPIFNRTTTLRSTW